MTCCLRKRIMDLLFADTLDSAVRCGQCAGLEPLTKKFFQSLPVCEKPAFHTDHHEMTLLMSGALWL